VSIKIYIVGELESNCYFIIDDETKDTFIVDPGAEPEKLDYELKKFNLNPCGIFNTHGHIDHISGNSYLKSKYNIPVYIHEQDNNLLTDSISNLSSIMYTETIILPSADKLLTDNEIIRKNNIELKIIHTPGHTPGSICIVYNKKYIFTGDTLFCGSVGRCDLPGGNEQILLNSLEKLKHLPESMIILPGHGPQCNLKDELIHNPYLTR